MDRKQVVHRLRSIERRVGDRYYKWAVDKRFASFPAEALVPLDEARNVLLRCSLLVHDFDSKVYAQELALAQELAQRNRKFAVVDDPSLLFSKSVAWFLPNDLVSPPLWNYSQQVYEFASGLERQGNNLLCSSEETMYWENKVHMHRRFDEIGVPTPKTKFVTRENWRSIDFDIEPALMKEEHSAGSSGIHYFDTALEAQEFIRGYQFRTSETLIMQEVVRGATKDLRLTMVGHKMIESASFWRIKSTQGLESATWTTTASKYGSSIVHENIPESVVSWAAEYLRRLGIRTAGIDLMWVDDDVSRDPLVLELSPYYQPNPPKPRRYDSWTYRQYKERPYVKQGYVAQQYQVLREIAREILDQRLF